MDDAKEGGLAHGTRLYEAEAAITMGITFDARWYLIPKEVREQIIAARLARLSITNVLTKDAYGKT